MEAGSLTVILDTLQTQNVLWETYAFFDLFFGDTGLIRRNSTEGGAEASATGAAMGEAAPTTGGRRFLQEATPAPESSTGTSSIGTPA